MWTAPRSFISDLHVQVALALLKPNSIMTSPPPPIISQFVPHRPRLSAQMFRRKVWREKKFPRSENMFIIMEWFHDEKVFMTFMSELVRVFLPNYSPSLIMGSTHPCWGTPSRPFFPQYRVIWTFSWEELYARTTNAHPPMGVLGNRLLLE